MGLGLEARLSPAVVTGCKTDDFHLGSGDGGEDATTGCGIGQRRCSGDSTQVCKEGVWTNRCLRCVCARLTQASPFCGPNAGQFLPCRQLVRETSECLRSLHG